jgi:hypothetical protein
LLLVSRPQGDDEHRRSGADGEDEHRVRVHDERANRRCAERRRNRATESRSQHAHHRDDDDQQRRKDEQHDEQLGDEFEKARGPLSCPGLAVREHP